MKTLSADGVLVWTDGPLVAKNVLPDIRAAAKFLSSIAPARSAASAPASRPARPGRPVAIAIYGREADYRKLWRRVGAHYGGVIAKVVTDGYSYRVFCATSYGSAKEFAARRRPVVSHEFAHVWLYQSRGLANDGNWLTEGIANAVQLRLFPGSGDRADFARWMRAGRMLPLKRLMDLDRIAGKDYWQAATLVETLLIHHAERLPAVIAAYNKGESANTIVTRALGTDFVTLQARWAEHVRKSGKVATTRRAQ